MSEKLLQYVWKHRLWKTGDLRLTDGRPVEILDPGIHNADQGPDFFNAKVRVEGRVWAGNVEIHVCASDWVCHGHHQDAAYENVILHVVWTSDTEVFTLGGRQAPQFVLPVPDPVASRYEELCRDDRLPRCHEVLPSLPPLKVHAWMDALLAERLEERAALFLARMEKSEGSWEKATFASLSRTLGMGLNGDAFERWAMLVPSVATARHRSDLFQLEALFLGMAGLIGRIDDASQRESLEREFAFLSHKFSLPPALESHEWKYMRLRPYNFPHVRLRQLARLVHLGKASTSALLEAHSIGDFTRALPFEGMTPQTLHLLIINTVVPLYYAWGVYHRQDHWKSRAVELLEHLPAEKNRFVQEWRACGIGVEHAADSQALLQLSHRYCTSRRCLQCRWAYDFLRS